MDFKTSGSFLCIDGPAKLTNKMASQQKLCFTATDFEFLKSLLKQLSKNEECYFVKTSKKSRDGMYLGRCFFTSPNKAWAIWAEYKNHPKLRVSIQNDDVRRELAKEIKSWDGL